MYTLSTQSKLKSIQEHSESLGYKDVVVSLLIDGIVKIEFNIKMDKQEDWIDKVIRDYSIAQQNIRNGSTLADSERKLKEIILNHYPLK